MSVLSTRTTTHHPILRAAPAMAAKADAEDKARRRKHKKHKKQTLVSSIAAQTAGYAALWAGLVSFGVAQIMLVLVEQVEALLAFTALAAAMAYGLWHLLCLWFEEDGKVSRLEAFFLDSTALVKLVLIFCAGQFSIRIMTVLLAEDGQSLPCIVAMIAALIFIMLAFIPFVTNTVLLLPGHAAAATKAVSDDDGVSAIPVTAGRSL